MPATIRTGWMKYKNPNSGEYQGIDAITDATTEERVAAINSAAANQIAAVEAKGEETIASIPSDYQTLSDEVNTLIMVDDEPEDTTKLLIELDNPVQYNIPEIDDNFPSLTDTYSSSKILSIIDPIKQAIGMGKIYTNPVASLENIGMADPCAVKDDNVFYVYTTHSRVQIHKSTNLIDYESCGTAITDEDYATLCTITNNQSTKVWAPCVIKHGDLWLMYASVVAGTTATNCHMCVFSSSRPDGKWKFRAEICNASSISLNDCIDADVVRDSDGLLYMFIGSSYGIYLIKLSDDGLSMDTSFTKVLIHSHSASDGNDTRLEGSYCFWRNGYYYLFNSAGMYTQGGNYHLVVSRSANLSGPYLNQNGDSLIEASNTGTTILNGTTALSGSGHNGNIFIDNEGAYWILYHAYPSGQSYRQLCLQRIYWDQNGWPYFENSSASSMGPAPKL